MKTCGICHESKPFDQFGKDGGAGYLRYECKQCAKRQSKLLKAIKKTAPVPETDHRCPVCLRNWQEMQGYSLRKKNWACDHDHATGEFRGWLCHKCNLALGNLGDCVERLLRAADYLVTSQNGSTGVKK